MAPLSGEGDGSLHRPAGPPWGGPYRAGQETAAPVMPAAAGTVPAGVSEPSRPTR